MSSRTRHENDVVNEPFATPGPGIHGEHSELGSDRPATAAAVWVFLCGSIATPITPGPPFSA